MKLVYVHEDGTQELVTEFAANHMVSVQYILDQVGIDMDQWAEDKGYEGYDFNALTVVQ